MVWLWAVVIVQGVLLLLLWAGTNQMSKDYHLALHRLAQAHDALAGEVSSVTMRINSIEQDRRGW